MVFQLSLLFLCGGGPCGLPAVMWGSKVVQFPPMCTGTRIIALELRRRLRANSLRCLVSRRVPETESLRRGDLLRTLAQALRHSLTSAVEQRYDAYAWCCEACWDELVCRESVRPIPVILSVTHPTRLETRTKESNMCASHWVAKLNGEMRVKVSLAG